ncbi:MAG: hypothetical protein ACREDP_20210, partial [Bradyrhizobium sp.]
EVEDEDNDEKRDEYTDKHGGPLGWKCAVYVATTCQETMGSGLGTSMMQVAFPLCTAGHANGRDEARP